jgi:hypothetical protein
MIDYAKGARSMWDIDPNGPTPERLPHRYLPLTGYDRHYENGAFVDDDGTCCQFTSGRARCKSTRVDHTRVWPEDRFDPAQ